MLHVRIHIILTLPLPFFHVRFLFLNIFIYNQIASSDPVENLRLEFNLNESERFQTNPNKSKQRFQYQLMQTDLKSIRIIPTSDSFYLILNDF